MTPRFTPEQIEEAKRLILTVEQARDAYPYHESVTPMDIAGHTLDWRTVKQSYKEAQ